MNYEQAVRSAQNGERVLRPHWCWVYISASEHREGKLGLFDEEDGHERGPFRPTRSDKKATDWRVMK